MGAEVAVRVVIEAVIVGETAAEIVVAQVDEDLVADLAPAVVSAPVADVVEARAVVGRAEAADVVRGAKAVLAAEVLREVVVRGVRVAAGPTTTIGATGRFVRAN